MNNGTGQNGQIPIDIDRVKRIVDILMRAQVVDTILEIMAHGYGEASFKVAVQAGEIKIVTLTGTKTVKIIDEIV